MFGSILNGLGSAIGGLFGGSQQNNTNDWGLGNIGNTMANTALGIYMSGHDFRNQKRLMAYQSQLNREEYGMRHQLEVDDLRAAGLNPILSANSAGSIPGVGLGSAPDTSGHIDRTSSAFQREQQNQLFKSQMTELGSRTGLNTANAQASLLNAETNRMQTLGNLSLQRTQQLVNNALKSWYVTQASTMQKFPPNNSRIERELRGIGRLIGDSDNLLNFNLSNSARSLTSPIPLSTQWHGTD